MQCCISAHCAIVVSRDFHYIQMGTLEFVHDCKSPWCISACHAPLTPQCCVLQLLLDPVVYYTEPASPICCDHLAIAAVTANDTVTTAILVDLVGCWYILVACWSCCVPAHPSASCANCWCIMVYPSPSRYMVDCNTPCRVIPYPFICHWSWLLQPLLSIR